MTRISDEELEQWAKTRADDAGRLARELLQHRLTAALASAAEPFGYVVEERKPPRFTFQKTRPSISDDDMSEFEITIDPVYAEPKTSKQLAPVDVYRILRRHYDEAPITRDDLSKLSRDIAALSIDT